MTSELAKELMIRRNKNADRGEKKECPPDTSPKKIYDKILHSMGKIANHTWRIANSNGQKRRTKSGKLHATQKTHPPLIYGKKTGWNRELHQKDKEKSP